MKKILMGLMFMCMLFITGCAEEEVVLNEKTDAELFSEEYDSVSADNLFEYKNIEETIKILENATGVVYLGYSECPLCVAYVPMLNDVAKSYGISEINYFNIKDDRADNTEGYQQIVSLLENYLGYDSDGNHRVYVPSIVVVVDGEIKGFDDETSYDTKGFSEPSEYWNDEEVTELKNKLSTMMEELSNYNCSTC